MMHEGHVSEPGGGPADDVGELEANEFVDVNPLLAPPADDPLYRDVWDRVQSQESKRPALGGGALLLVSAVLFALSFQVLEFDAATVAFLAGVVLIHELGHLAAMKVFGYRDLRIFFIPFFGGAAAGKKSGAPAWQQGVVLLAGPLPGILLAAPLSLAGQALDVPGEWTRSAVTLLLGLNVFNLLPIDPLDGGRLMQLTLFSRHPLLETLFRVLAVAGLGLLALTGGWVLWVLAGLMLITLPMSHRRARQRLELRRARPDFPVELAELEEGDRRELFGRARSVFPIAPGKEPKGYANSLANIVRQLHAEVVTHPPGLLATALLLGTYLAAWVASVVVVVIVALSLRP